MVGKPLPERDMGEKPVFFFLKLVGQKHIGKEFVGEKHLGKKSVGEKHMSEKSVGEDTYG